MAKSVISEGRTTSEAIEKGLKELSVSKNMVDIKYIQEEKRSFFSILAPRVVKVELTVKEGITENVKSNEKEEVKEHKKIVKKEIEISEEDQEKAKNNVEKFLTDFIKQLPEGTKYNIEKNKSGLNVSLTSAELGFLIGYRGETLYAMQTILSAIAGKGIEQKVRVILDIEGYKAKREKTLEDLAEKIAKTVIKSKKSVTLEPMQAYERKIIHSKLQENSKVETYSVGEEPRRRVVIALKK
ncbi:MAG: Jag N-terminal domain-containing protein [Clostridia bacterium]|nr:Jag N-terminal domain-containing protein [Clostridia bacterium]